MKDESLLAKPRIDAAFHLLSTIGIEGLRLPPVEVKDCNAYQVDVTVHYCAIGHLEHLADKGNLTDKQMQIAACSFRKNFGMCIRDHRSLRDPLTARELVGMLRGCEMHTGTTLSYPVFAELWMMADKLLVPCIAESFATTAMDSLKALKSFYAK